MLRPMPTRTFLWCLVIVAAILCHAVDSQYTTTFSAGAVEVDQQGFNDAPERWATFVDQAVEYVNKQRLPDVTYGDCTKIVITGSRGYIHMQKPTNVVITIGSANTVTVDFVAPFVTAAWVQAWAGEKIIWCFKSQFCNDMVTLSGNAVVSTVFTFNFALPTQQVSIVGKIASMQIANEQYTVCTHRSWFYDNIISHFAKMSDIINAGITFAEQQITQKLQQSINVPSVFVVSTGVTLTSKVSNMVWVDGQRIVLLYTASVTAATPAGPVTYQTLATRAAVQAPATWSNTAVLHVNGSDILFKQLNGFQARRVVLLLLAASSDMCAVQATSELVNALLWGLWVEGMNAAQQNATVLDASLFMRTSFSCPTASVPETGILTVQIEQGRAVVTCTGDETDAPQVVLDFGFGQVLGNATVQYSTDGVEGSLWLHVNNLDPSHFQPVLNAPKLFLPDSLISELLTTMLRNSLPQINTALRASAWLLPPAAVPEVGYANVAVQPQVVAGLAGIGYIQVDAMCTCDRKVAAAWALCQSGCGAADASPSHALGAPALRGSSAPMAYATVFSQPGCMLDSLGAAAAFYTMPLAEGCQVLLTSDDDGDLTSVYNATTGALSLLCNANCSACAYRFADIYNTSSVAWAFRDATCADLDGGVSARLSLQPPQFDCAQQLVRNATMGNFTVSPTLYFTVNATLAAMSGRSVAYATAMYMGAPDQCGLAIDQQMYGTHVFANHTASVFLACDNGTCADCVAEPSVAVVTALRPYDARAPAAVLLSVSTLPTCPPPPPPPGPPGPPVPVHTAALTFSLCLVVILAGVLYRVYHASWPAIDLSGWHAPVMVAFVAGALTVLFFFVGWGAASPVLLDSAHNNDDVTRFAQTWNTTALPAASELWRRSGVGLMAGGAVLVAALLCVLVAAHRVLMPRLAAESVWRGRVAALTALAPLVSAVLLLALLLLSVVLTPLSINLGAVAFDGYVSTAYNGTFSGLARSSGVMFVDALVLRRVSVILIVFMYFAAFAFMPSYLLAFRLSNGRKGIFGIGWTGYATATPVIAVACVTPVVIQGQSTGASLWWMVMNILVWVCLSLAAVIVNIAPRHDDFASTRWPASTAGVIGVISLIGAIAITSMQDLLTPASGALWVLCSLSAGACMGAATAVFDFMWAPLVEAPAGPSAYDEIKDTKDAPDSVYARFFQWWPAVLSARRICLAVGMICLAVVLEREWLFRDANSAQAGIQALLTELGVQTAWPANGTVFDSAFALYDTMANGQLYAMTVLTLIGIVMAGMAWWMPATDAQDTIVDTERLPLMQIQQPSADAAVDLTAAPGTKPDLVRAGQLRFFRGLAVVCALLVAVAILVVAAPSYLSASQLGQLCPTCAPRFNSAVRQVLNTAIGLGCAALLSSKVLIAVLTVPIAAMRPLAVRAFHGRLKPWMQSSAIAMMTAIPLASVLPAVAVVQLLPDDVAAAPLAYFLFFGPSIVFLFMTVWLPRWWLLRLLLWMATYLASWVVAVVVIAARHQLLDLLASVLSSWVFWLEAVAEVCLSSVVVSELIDMVD